MLQTAQLAIVIFGVILVISIPNCTTAPRYLQQDYSLEDLSSYDDYSTSILDLCNSLLNKGVEDAPDRNEFIACVSEIQDTNDMNDRDPRTESDAPKKVTKTFKAWNGKRTFGPWNGKRTFEPWRGKRLES